MNPLTPQEHRELVFKLGNGRCMCSPECVEMATDEHHLLSNTKTNRNLYPLFVSSIFNKMPLNNGCHVTKPIPKIRYEQAAIYEEWLQDFREKIIEETKDRVISEVGKI